MFVSNVLNGTVAAGGNVVHGGTVVRMTLNVTSEDSALLQSITVIGSGFPERTDPAALVIGPTGVGLDAKRTRYYVADSLNNRVAAIPLPFRATPQPVPERRSRKAVASTILLA